jgi:hypothetical protein
MLIFALISGLALAALELGFAFLLLAAFFSICAAITGIRARRKKSEILSTIRSVFFNPYAACSAPIGLSVSSLAVTIGVCSIVILEAALLPLILKYGSEWERHWSQFTFITAQVCVVVAGLILYKKSI